jgi:hypothetical protein
MSDRPKAAPDGEPKQPAKDRDDTSKSKITEVQDPLIEGDAKKAGNRAETDEATVDEAGQIRKKNPAVDLRH